MGHRGRARPADRRHAARARAARGLRAMLGTVTPTCRSCSTTAGSPISRAVRRSSARRPLLALAGFPACTSRSRRTCSRAEARRRMARRRSSSGCTTTFGAERLVWGSDYPQTHDRSYAALVELGRDACAGLPAADRDRFLGGNALRLWPELTGVTSTRRPVLYWRDAIAARGNDGRVAVGDGDVPVHRSRGLDAAVGGAPGGDDGPRWRVTTRSCASAIASHHGHVVKTTGDGFHAVFARPDEAWVQRSRRSERSPTRQASGERATPRSYGCAHRRGRGTGW